MVATVKEQLLSQAKQVSTAQASLGAQKAQLLKPLPKSVILTQTPLQVIKRRTSTKAKLAQIVESQQALKTFKGQVTTALEQIKATEISPIEQVAREAIQRKAEGKRISFLASPDPSESKKIFAKLAKQPKIRAALDRAAGLKGLALKLGLKDIQELVFKQAELRQLGPEFILKIPESVAKQFPKLFPKIPIAPTVVKEVIPPKELAAIEAVESKILPAQRAKFRRTLDIIRETATKAEPFLEKIFLDPFGGKKVREGDVFFATSTGEVVRELPFGLTPFGASAVAFEIQDGKPVQVDKDTVVGKIGKAFFAVGRAIAKEESRLLEEAGIKKGKIRTALETEVKISPELQDLPGQIAVGLLFEPLIVAAAAKKGTVQQVAKREKVAKKKSKKTIKEFEKVFEESFKKGDNKKIAEDLNKILNTIRNQKNIELQKQGIKNFQALLKGLKDKNILKEFIFDTKNLRFLRTTGKAVKAPTTIEIDVTQIAEQLAGLPKLKGLGGITALVPKITTVTKPPITKVPDFAASKFTGFDLAASKISTTQIGKLGAISLTQQGQKIRAAQKELEKQITKQIPAIKQIPKIKQAPKLGQAFKQAQKASQAQKFKQPLKLKVKLKKPFGPVPIIFRKKKKEDKIFKKPVKKRLGFIPQAKDKGIWRNVTKLPLKTPALAIKEARFAVDQTTSAQLRVLTKEKVKKFGKPSLKVAPSQNFRDFRIVKGKQIPLKNFGEIELRKARISTLGEKQQLSLAKFLKKKQQGLFPKIKPFKIKF